MSQKRVSIVTISYNQKRFLEKALRSVLDQKTPEVEYVVVDPGSTDGSRDVLRSYAAEIDHLVLEPDQGPADGLNQGFAKASGDILAYLNSDDELAPGAIAFARDYLDTHPDADVLLGAVRVTDEHGRPEWRKRCPDRFDLRRFAAGICTLGQQATFIRREIFFRAGGFNVANRCCWDGELMVDMAIAGARFHSVDKVLGDYRIYEGSLTGSGIFSTDKYRREHARLVDKIRQHGVEVDEGLMLFVKRMLYKVNAARHMRYLLVR